MKTTISPSQAEDAVDALKGLKIRQSISRAGYGISKNVLTLSRITKDFVKYRDAELRAAYPNGEKPDPSSEKYAGLSVKLAAKAREEVEVSLIRVKLSDLFAVCNVEDVTTLPAIEFMLEDDLELDALEPKK